MPEGEVIIAAAPAPAKPHAPSQYIVHSGCFLSSLKLWEGVQSAKKFARTWDFIDVLFSNSIKC
jgi:hypothetical protein